MLTPEWPAQALEGLHQGDRWNRKEATSHPLITLRLSTLCRTLHANGCVNVSEIRSSHCLSLSRCTGRTARRSASSWRCWWPKTPTWRSSCRFPSGRTSGRSASAASRTSNTSSASWTRPCGSRSPPSATRPRRPRLPINSQRRPWITAPLTDTSLIETRHRNDSRTWWISWHKLWIAGLKLLDSTRNLKNNSTWRRCSVAPGGRSVLVAKFFCFFFYIQFLC